MNKYYSSYKKQSVSTMTNIEVVVKLYEECEKQLHIAKNEFEKEKPVLYVINNALIKVFKIMHGLREMLNMDIKPISFDLDSIYVYIGEQAIKANVKKDVEIMKPLIPMVRDLREAFTEISKLPKGNFTVPSDSVRGAKI